MKKLFVLMLMTTILYTGYNFLQDDTVYLTNRSLYIQAIPCGLSLTAGPIRTRMYAKSFTVSAKTNALANTNLKPGQKLLVPVRMQFVDQLMVAEVGDIKG